MAANSPANLALEEWKEARGIIDKIDDRLNDLRKYGLTFVSGLLTAQALIDSSQPGSSTYVSPGVKLAVIFASLVLICALYVIEIINRQIQHATASRAKEIERNHHMGLTRAISKAFSIYHVTRSLDFLYAMMVGAAGILGFYVVGGGTPALDSLTTVEIGGTVAAEVFVISVHIADWLTTRKFDRGPVGET